MPNIIRWRHRPVIHTPRPPCMMNTKCHQLMLTHTDADIHSQKNIIIHVYCGVRLCAVCSMRCAMCGIWIHVQQCAAVCGSVWQCAAVCGSVQQCAAVCGRAHDCVRQCGSVCGSAHGSVQLSGSARGSVRLSSGAAVCISLPAVCIFSNKFKTHAYKFIWIRNESNNLKIE
jgi:hypothetical protein